MTTVHEAAEPDVSLVGLPVLGNVPSFKFISTGLVCIQCRGCFHCLLTFIAVVVFYIQTTFKGLTVLFLFCHLLAAVCL